MSFRLVDFNFVDKAVESEYASMFEKGSDDSDSDNDDDGNNNAGTETTSESGSSAAPSPVRTVGAPNKKPPRVFQIQMFGMNEQGKTCSITVPDFKPFFYAKVNCSSDRTREWTSSVKTKFINYLKSMAPELKSASGLVDTECELVHHKKLYMFDAGKDHQFIKLVFHSLSAMKRARNLWFIKLQPDTSAASGAKGKSMFESSRMKMNPRGLQFQEYNLTIYESNLPPLLRYFHIREISPSGWISFPLKSAHRVTVPDLKRTTCDYEFIIGKNDITAMNTKEKMVPYNVCSFDIEASSSHGDFPIPVKTYKKLAANVVDAAIKHPESLSPAMLETCMCVAFGASEADINTYPWLFGIERIYPKTHYPNGKRVQCTLTEVKRMCTVWTTTPVDALEVGLKEQGVSNVLKIETMFERIKSREMGGDGLDVDIDASFSDNDNEEGADNAGVDEDDNGNDNDGEYDECDGDGDGDGDGDDTDAATCYSRSARSVCSAATGVSRAVSRATSGTVPSTSKTKPTMSSASGPTVLDIIRNAAFDRETKINKVNETMCAAFPPVQGDIVTFIGSTFVKHGQSGPYCNHCIVLDT
jgi:hypothetical protein